MNEDDSLHRLIKDYASHNKPLPGVKSASVAGQNYGGTSCVPLYKNDRSRLVVDYALPWLQALYDQDSELYSHMLYERSKMPLQPRIPTLLTQPEEVALDIAEAALDRLTSALEAKIVFGGVIDIIVAWLHDLGELARKDRSFRLLPRLIGVGLPEDDNALWAAVKAAAVTSAADHAKVCMWTRILSLSGVSVPWELVQNLMDEDKHLSLRAIQDLVATVDANGNGVAMAHLADLACDLFEALAVALIGGQSQACAAVDEETALHGSLCLVLKAYGVSIQDRHLTSLADTSHAEFDPTASSARRKRLTVAVGSLDLRRGTISSIASLLMVPRLPTAKLVDTLWLLSNKAALVSNVDGFLYDTALDLFERLWSLLARADVRQRVMKLLLRLLSVRSSSIRDHVYGQMGTNRTATRDRLLEFLLRLVEDHTGTDRPTVSTGIVGLLLILFEDALDPRSTSPDTQTLLGAFLPTQLCALSRCFSDYLIRSDDETRMHVLESLARLQRAMPNWALLTWSTLEQLLAEQVAAVTQMTSWTGPTTGSALSETHTLRAQLVALGLEILASGIDIPWTTAQRFQQHVASACALPWSVPNEGIIYLILPALRSVLDSPYHLSPGGQNRRSVLVGALFVPVVIDFGNELKRHDYLTQRSLLDILHVTIYKQELRTVELAVLGALQSIADYAASPGSTENRLLALRILNTALLRVAAQSMLRVSPPIFTSIAKAFVGEMVESGDAAIVEQSRKLLRTMIDTFGKSGLFVQVFRVDSRNSRWSGETSSVHRAINVLVGGDGGPAILDILFEDISDVLRKDPDGLSDMLSSLQRFTSLNEVELSEDAAEYVGLLITRVTKHIAEWDIATFEPDALLNVCQHLLDHLAPASTSPLSHQMSTFLVIALSRFDVHSDTLDALLKKFALVTGRAHIENTAEMVVFEEAVRKGLHDSRTTPLSLITLIKCILANHTRDPEAVLPVKAILESSSACVSIISRQHPVYASSIDADVSLNLLSAAAHLLLAAETLDDGLLARHLTSLSELAAQARCELFAQLLLADKNATTVARFSPDIARSTSLCLRAIGDLLSVTDTGGEGPEILACVFNVVRLVMLSMDKQPSEIYWDRVWPDWCRLINISTEQTCVNAPLRLVSQSVFLDIVIFLGSIDSRLLISRSENLSNIISVIDKWTKANAATGGTKVEKARSALKDEDQRTQRKNQETISRKVESDILASEKLKSLRVRR